jgi:hypothetical protein
MFFVEMGNPPQTMVGKIIGDPDPDFPYMFEILGNDGSIHDVNSDRIIMKLP